jgi:copper chaperone CopZ
VKTTQIEVPAMYADHHVLEVRRILLELPGVTAVLASSGFQLVEVTYDPAEIEETVIHETLAAHGYLGGMLTPAEPGKAAYKNEANSFFRHTEAMESTRNMVSFAQKVAVTGRPLWNCPGFGVIKTTMED